jgi:phosphoglycerol transferase MdoB-like AlkP superfamily enzyme
MSTVAIRWILVLYLATCSLVIWLVGSVAAASWILAGFAGAICLLLPLRFGVVTFAGLIGLNVLLTWINRAKVDLTGMPITMLDIRIATGNPAGLWYALSLPQWSRYIAETAAILALAGWVLAGLLAARRILDRSLKRAITFERLGRILAVGVLGIVMWSYLQTLYVTIGRDDSTWHHVRVSRLSDRVGIFPFLGYSYHIESSAIGDIYTVDSSASPPSRDEVAQAILHYMRFPPEGKPKDEVRPNIVIVLAESTFDPSQFFRLQGEWNADLFSQRDLTAAMGALRVNTKGGATWVAEFETITGLDSRLFGYSGAYTHASLSPFVERSLATYLEKRGYETWAFLATSGRFYNSRRAYESYGFDRVLDSADLGSESGWFATDTAVIESVKTSLGPNPVAPFFSYIVLIENHGPHECDVADAGNFTAQFSDTADFGANCALHEYLRRLDSTAFAIQSLIDYLADSESHNGRPFVLLIFGDHQPFTFTGSGEIIADFSPYRKSPDMYTTFFHFLSSAQPRLNCCSRALPIAALPTLVSGFVASGPDDVFLGENLWLYDHCGPNAIGRDFADRMSSLEISGLDERTEACKAAYARVLASYRSAGIIRLEQ